MPVLPPEPKTDWSGRSRRDGGTAHGAGGWRRRRRPAPSWASWAAARPPEAAAAGSSPPLDQQRHANAQLRPDSNSEAQAAGLEKKQELSRESREILSRGESCARSNQEKASPFYSPFFPCASSPFCLFLSPPYGGPLSLSLSLSLSISSGGGSKRTSRGFVGLREPRKRFANSNQHCFFLITLR